MSNQSPSVLKPSWKDDVPLSIVILTVVLLALAVNAVATWFYVSGSVREQKLADLWAIVFLNLERQGEEIHHSLEALDHHLNADPSANPPDIEALVEPSKGTLKTVNGRLPPGFMLRDLRLEATPAPDSLSLTTIDGQAYFVQKSKSQDPNGAFAIRLWKTRVTDWFPQTATSNEKTVYLITREGSLLYSNDSSIRQSSFSERPLVQRYIASSLQRGQLEFEDNANPKLGFFSEIHQTNLLLFAEIPKMVTLKSMETLSSRLLVGFFIVFILFATILYLILEKLLKPLETAMVAAREVARGNFELTLTDSGFGEVRELLRSFKRMANALSSREKAVTIEVPLDERDPVETE